MKFCLFRRHLGSRRRFFLSLIRRKGAPGWLHPAALPHRRPKINRCLCLRVSQRQKDRSKVPRVLSCRTWSTVPACCQRSHPCRMSARAVLWVIAFISVGCPAVTWVHAGSKLLNWPPPPAANPGGTLAAPESHRIIDGEPGAAWLKRSRAT